jgi:Dyp-type peroxidase family
MADTGGTTSLRYSTEIQGNILAPFPDEHQTWICATFNDARGARRWLAAVTPAVTVTAEISDVREPGRTYLAVSFTNLGLELLCPSLVHDLACFPSFTSGAAARAGALRDRGPSAPRNWVFGCAVGSRRELPVHAVVLIASTSRSALKRGVDIECERLARHGGQACYVQNTARLTGGLAGREHFGFTDGISQPAVRGYHLADPAEPQQASDAPGSRLINAGEFILGHPGQRPGGRPVPHAEWMRDGSFQVIRRLTQDVERWWRAIEIASSRLRSADRVDPTALAARLVGRWPNGAPLALAAEREPSGCGKRHRLNDFRFDDDPTGAITPRSAHIRKMYPRRSDFAETEWRRIIRRGVPFGSPGEGERGLFFVAYMASIEDQFEFLQMSWANSPDFPEPGDGEDPIVGRSTDTEGATPLRSGRCSISLERFVTTTGGLYCFAPSVSWLSHVSSGL